MTKCQFGISDNNHFAQSQYISSGILLSEWRMRPKQFVCNYCHKTFRLWRDLDGHVNNVHLKIRPYVCHKCKKGYGQKRTLQMHMKYCVNN